MVDYQNQIMILIDSNINFELDEVYYEGEAVTLCLDVPNHGLVWLEGIELSDVNEFIFNKYKNEFSITNEDELYDAIVTQYTVNNDTLKDFIINKITDFEHNNNYKKEKKLPERELLPKGGAKRAA